jgi:hypothetical protein
MRLDFPAPEGPYSINITQNFRFRITINDKMKKYCQKKVKERERERERVENHDGTETSWGENSCDSFEYCSFANLKLDVMKLNFEHDFISTLGECRQT